MNSYKKALLKSWHSTRLFVRRLPRFRLPIVILIAPTGATISVSPPLLTRASRVDLLDQMMLGQGVLERTRTSLVMLLVMLMTVVPIHEERRSQRYQSLFDSINSFGIVDVY